MTTNSIERLNLISSSSAVFERVQSAFQTRAEIKDVLTSDEFYGKVGAGVVVLAADTGRFLLGKRAADVPEPGTWCSWGGKVEVEESIFDGAKREFSEETGFSGRIRMAPLFVFRKDDFEFHSWVGVVEHEFTPNCRPDETSVWGWYSWGDFPSPVHFGLRAVMNDSRARSILESLLT